MTVVTLRNISHRYPSGNGQFVLHRCDLDIMPGDFLVLMGASGSGKSTLLNIVGLLDRPTSGTYLFEGTDVSKLSDSERTRIRGTKIGFVFQSFHLLEQRSLVENVMLADLYRGTSKKESESRARQQLTRVGLGQLVDRTPMELSGGQRQRVAIARALAAAPSLLLCDEPTGNLDSRNTKQLLELFRELNRDGVTILMITHDSTVAEAGTRLMSISDGRVSAVALGGDHG